jgi:DNA-directed RNA polymerase
MEDTNKPVGEKLLKKTSNIKSVHDIRDLARYLISMGIDRKTVKRQVMVLPYGGTYRSTMDYTRKWLEECYKVSGKPEMDERDLSVYLSRVVWDALNAGLEKPQEVMQWLRDCAAVVVGEGIGLQWETPTGFPVLQRYLKHESKAVTLWTGEKVSKRSNIRIVQPNENELDTARMRNGVAPNYVHSLDAACLMKTIENMMQFGITNFCVIHDSFGTLPSDVDAMQACIRKAYSDVFSADQLGIFREQILAQLPPEKQGDVPPVPSYGKLDPTKVCESEFFFA